MSKFSDSLRKVRIDPDNEQLLQKVKRKLGLNVPIRELVNQAVRKYWSARTK